MPLQYNPTTEDGAGFLPPIFKALHHIHVVTVASAYGWPITNETASAEITHALRHIDALGPTADITSNEGQNNINDWTQQVRDLQTAVRTLEQAAPEGLITADNPIRETLKTIETQGWALLSQLDTELLGYGPEITDAGRKP